VAIGFIILDHTRYNTGGIGLLPVLPDPPASYRSPERRLARAKVPVVQGAKPRVLGEEPEAL